MRLIDADRLSEVIYDNVSALYEDAVCAKEDCLAEIEAAQTVDAVPVVRCRECEYHNKPPCPMRLSFSWTGDDDFCSYGERKKVQTDGLF